MNTPGITINGQHYDSPEAMPPDVRRLYEDALRTIESSRAAGTDRDSTQVLTGSALPGVKTSIVIRKTFSVNGRTYSSLDEMPPNVRQRVESGLRTAQATTAPAIRDQHLALEIGKPQLQIHFSGPSPSQPRPMQPSSMDSGAREFLTQLVFWVVVALILWALMGRIHLWG